RETSRGGRSFVEASPEQSPRERVPIRDRNPGRRDRKNKTNHQAPHQHHSGEAATYLRRPRPWNLL
uniref:Uncharacterized protein n=1 Tax=Aegilops tauschii subsp. strangulata TaxID=200361 RepID=A0A453RLC2_AEGTS